jgi:hypothetical protein
MQPFAIRWKYSPPVTACLKKDRLYETFVALAAIP